MLPLPEQLEHGGLFRKKHLLVVLQGKSNIKGLFSCINVVTNGKVFFFLNNIESNAQHYNLSLKYNSTIWLKQ